MTEVKPPTRRPRRRTRRALWGVLALVVLAVAGHGVAWVWATGALAVGMSDWVTQRRAEGWTVSHGPPARGGWPFAARLAVPDVRIEAPARVGQAGLAHAAQRVVLQIGPPRLDRLLILFEGRQRLQLGDAALPFVAERLALSVPLVAGPALEAEATALDALLPDGPLLLRTARVVVVQPGGPRPGAAAARVTEADPALAVALQAEGAVLPDSPLAAALGREVEALAAEVLLSGPMPWPGPPAVMAAWWRDGGGALDIASLALRWGPLAGDARGRLVLDGALQPQGRGTLRLAGAPEALDALARAGLIDGSAARGAQGVVALLGRVPPEGGPPRVELPVALANGTLSLARVPLVRVAPIAWPSSRGR